MIIREDSKIRFVLESKEEFFFESNDRAIAEISVEDGTKVPISVKDHDGQFHVEAHPELKIPGRVAFAAYEAFASSDEGLFGLWIDPCDGEVKVVEHLVTATAEELDRGIEEVRRVLNCAWDGLGFFSKSAAEQSQEDRNVFDITDLVLESFSGEDD